MNHLEYGTKKKISSSNLLVLGEKFHGCDILYGIEEAVTRCVLYRTLDHVLCSENKQEKLLDWKVMK